MINFFFLYRDWVGFNLERVILLLLGQDGMSISDLVLSVWGILVLILSASFCGGMIKSTRCALLFGPLPLDPFACS